MGGNNMVHFVKEHDLVEFEIAVSALDCYFKDCDGYKGYELNAWRFFEEVELLMKSKLYSAKTLAEYQAWCEGEEANVIKEQACRHAVQCVKSRAETLVRNCSNKLRALISI
jgi:hypothetical protein